MRYIPTDLFEGKEIPKAISSVKWNKIKKPTFSGVYVECDDLKICDIMDAGCGKFRTSDDDPLNLELPLFEHKFKIRLYVKNHSSHNVKKCNLSAVATIKILHI